MKEIANIVILLLVGLIFFIGINLILTKIILLISAGIFNFSLDDKFWLIFIVITIIRLLK